MNPKTAAIGAALTLAAIGAAIIVDDGKGGTVEVAPADFDTADTKSAVAVEALQDAGVLVDARIFSKQPKDGQAFFYKDSSGWVKVASSPCRKRPKGVKASECMHVAIPEKERFPGGDGGLIDWGDENVMQPGQWVGAGCVEVPCAIQAGEPDP